MASPTLIDAEARTMAKPKRWVPKKDFKPGGEKGKLHRELGIPEGQKIPSARLNAAARSDDPEIRRDAIRAKTMKGWRHRSLYKRKD
jgi:hypothetical protein